ncbi:MAG: protein kinase [Myxococcota bacterium]
MSAPRSFELLRPLPPHGPGERWRARVPGDPPRAMDIELLDRRWSDRADLSNAIRNDLACIAELDHPHLAVSTDLIRLEGRLAVIEPRPTGADLGFLDDQEVPRTVLVALAARIADALDALAGIGLAHGSLGSAAITLDRDGQVRVHGSALTRAELPAWSPDTGSLARLGVTPLAPEQLARARLEPTPRGDVYALGALLARWARGRPFGPARLRADEHSASVGERLKGLPEGPESPALHDLLQAMLAFEPDARPSPAEVRDRAVALSERLAGPKLPQWAAEHVPEPADEPETPQRVVVEEPWSDDTTAVTELMSRRAGFALDPGGTLEPLKGSDVEAWEALRDETLASVEPSDDPAPRPTGGPVRMGGLLLAALLGLGGLGAVTIAGLAAITLWSTGSASVEPTVVFRSGWASGHALLVSCDEHRASGRDRVILPPEIQGPCTVQAIDAEREARTTVVADVQPGTYLCFPLGEEACVRLAGP